MGHPKDTKYIEYQYVMEKSWDGRDLENGFSVGDIQIPTNSDWKVDVDEHSNVIIISVRSYYWEDGVSYVLVLSKKGPYGTLTRRGGDSPKKYSLHKIVGFPRYRSNPVQYRVEFRKITNLMDAGKVICHCCEQPVSWAGAILGDYREEYLLNVVTKLEDMEGRRYHLYFP